nr:MAG TPA: hypothetical protein [Caudoviricetes sp.]
MKVPINQINVSRVGVNTARIQGIRLRSASKGEQTSPFHPSLVDYWNFKGKINSDKDRNTIKGIKGEILTAYNFGWSLGSGYGLYKTNFLQWDYISSRGTAVVTSDTIHLTETFGNSNVVELSNLAYNSSENITVDVSGDFGGVNLIYIYYTSETESAQVVINTPGRYELPKSNRVNAGFKTNKATKLDLTIEQIPEYEGAIVTDGIDDYLKLDKVGYKIGTVIIKFVPIKFNVGWNTVFDNNKYDSPNRNFLGYSSTIENRGTTMFVSNYGDYLALYHNTPKQANDSLYISSSYTESFTAKEFFSMALYDIAIYQDVLTAEEIQKEINVMEYGTPNPVFALNFDNFAYKAVDYPEFATGKVTTNKIVIDSTTTQMNRFIVAAYNPDLTTGDAIELPSYKVKVTGIDAYSNLGDGYWAVALMGMPIDTSQDPWVYLFYKDGIYDIPAISLSESIYNLAVMCQIMVDKPIEIEILYDKNVTKSFPETKQIFP